MGKIGLRDLYEGGRYVHSSGHGYRIIDEIDGERVCWHDNIGRRWCSRKTFVKKVQGFAADTPPPPPRNTGRRRPSTEQVDDLINALDTAFVELSNWERMIPFVADPVKHGLPRDLSRTLEEAVGEVGLLVSKFRYLREQVRLWKKIALEPGYGPVAALRER